MTSPPPQEKVEIIKANRMLQAKVGTGKLNPELIKRAQDVIDENEIDFVPLAFEFLRELADSLQKAQAETGDEARHKESITNSVMQLKANAAIFHYNLVGNLAGNMLDFIEEIDEIDNDVIEIANAHYRTLNALITKRMAGTGGSFEKALEQELSNACRRYFAKHDKKRA